MSLSKDDARSLARLFLEASHDLGTYRFSNWGSLSEGQRQRIESAEWTLLNYSSDFVTAAVGLALHDMAADAKAIKDATAKAKEVIQTVQNVKNIIKVAAALVALGGAIASENAGAIATAALDLYQTAKGALDAPEN